MHVVHIFAIFIVLASILVSHFASLHSLSSTCPAISNAMLQTPKVQRNMQITAFVALFVVLLWALIDSSLYNIAFAIVMFAWVMIVSHNRNPSNTEVTISPIQYHGAIHNFFVIILFSTALISIAVQMKQWDTFTFALAASCVFLFPVLVVFSLFEHSCDDYNNQHYLIGLMEFVLLISILWLVVECEKSESNEDMFMQRLIHVLNELCKFKQV